MPILASLSLASLFIASLQLGSDAIVLRLNGGGIDTGIADTYTLVTFHRWMNHVTFLSLVAAGLLAVALRLGRPSIRALASIAAILWAISLWVALYPRSVLIAAPTPRRYADYPAAFETWAMVTTASQIAVMIASVVLLGCAALATYSRLRPKPD